jgi:hypothetical protein
VKLYAAHLKADCEPVLLREGFAWGALLFGPLWLAAQRAWIAAAITLAAIVLIPALAPPSLAAILLVGLAAVLGLTGYDLVAWSLDRRGYVLAHILAARGAEDALHRLLVNRPDLAARFARDIPV